MYSSLITEDMLNEIFAILNDEKESFEEKTQNICYLIKNKNVSNKVIKKYINIYLQKVNIKKLEECNSIFYELSKRKRHVILRDYLNNENLLKTIDVNHCLYYAVENDYCKNAKVLIDKNADINSYSLRLVYFSIVNKNLDMLSLLLLNPEKIKDTENCLNIILNSNWSTAINWVLKKNFWLSKINNNIVSDCRKNLSNENIELIEKANKLNKIEVF